MLMYLSEFNYKNYYLHQGGYILLVFDGSIRQQQFHFHENLTRNVSWPIVEPSNFGSNPDLFFAFHVCVYELCGETRTS